MALVEIDLYGDLMIAASSADEDRLSPDRIDEVLRVEADRSDSAERARGAKGAQGVKGAGKGAGKKPGKNPEKTARKDNDSREAEGPDAR
ncbi:hypothetical protein [Streptomyces sp. NPDC005336]|uniref:hypothetical protein n=1 Tax=unclassified Streptomyces TaxID=2593676 RepID=UPI0033A19AAE